MASVRRIIDGRHSRRVRIAEIRHLNRRRLACKNPQPISRGMPRQIHQNVDSIGTNQFCDRLIGKTDDVAPNIAGSLHPLAHVVELLHVRIAEDLEIPPIMMSPAAGTRNDRRNAAEIGRDIADAKPPLRRAIIGVGDNLAHQRAGVSIRPRAMFRQNLPGSRDPDDNSSRESDCCALQQNPARAARPAGMHAIASSISPMLFRALPRLLVRLGIIRPQPDAPADMRRSLRQVVPSPSTRCRDCCMLRHNPV